MGNLSFIVPTVNIKNNNKEKVCELLTSQFQKLRFEMEKDNDQINVYIRNPEKYCKGFVTNINFNQYCYLIEDYDADIKHLEENCLLDKDILIKELKELRDVNKVLMVKVKLVEH